MNAPQPSKKSLDKITALYYRLSPDDRQEGNSIGNQKAILQRYAYENGFRNIKYYVDDGYRGVHFNRPSVMALLDDVREGLISTVIVKDAYVKHRLKILQALHKPFYTAKSAINHSISIRLSG